MEAPTHARTRVATAEADSPQLKVYEKKTKLRKSPLDAPGPSETRKRHQI